MQQTYFSVAAILVTGGIVLRWRWYLTSSAWTGRKAQGQGGEHSTTRLENPLEHKGSAREKVNSTMSSGKVESEEIAVTPAESPKREMGDHASF